MAWDTARRRGVIYGGRSSSQAVDFWEFSLVGNDCSSDSECHNGVCVDTVCGDPPPVPEAGVSDADAAVDAGSEETDGSAGGSGGSAGEPNEDGGVSLGGTAPAGGASGGGEVTPRAGSKSLYACSTSPLQNTLPWPLVAAVFAALCLGLRRRRQ
jgi:hypothetical protein